VVKSPPSRNVTNSDQAGGLGSTPRTPKVEDYTPVTTQVLCLICLGKGYKFHNIKIYMMFIIILVARKYWHVKKSD
jgi:hypothetical protein